MSFPNILHHDKLYFLIFLPHFSYIFISLHKPCAIIQHDIFLLSQTLNSLQPYSEQNAKEQSYLAEALPVTARWSTNHRPLLKRFPPSTYLLRHLSQYPIKLQIHWVPPTNPGTATVRDIIHKNNLPGMNMEKLHVVKSGQLQSSTVEVVSCLKKYI